MSKYFMENNEKKARSHPRLRKNASRLLAPTTTTISKSPFRTLYWNVIARYTANSRSKYLLANNKIMIN